MTASPRSSLAKSRGRLYRGTPQMVLTVSWRTRTTPTAPHIVTISDSASTQPWPVRSRTCCSTSALNSAVTNGSFDHSASSTRCSASGRSLNTQVATVTNTTSNG